MALYRVLFIPLLAAAAAVAVAWAAHHNQDNSWKTVRRSGVIRIGYAVEAPFSYLTSDGEVTGQSPELAREVCAAMGLKRVDWRLVEFGSLLDELENGSIDVVASGMFITRPRAERFAFSEPVFHVRQGLLVAAGNPLGLHDYALAVSQTRARIAALSGSVEEAQLQRLGLTPPRLVHVPDAQTGRAAVESGLADALALSSATVTWMARTDRSGRTESAAPFEQSGQDTHRFSGYGAFVFRKRDQTLLAAWNAAQEPLVNSPHYLARIERFGFTADELPANVATKDVLAR